MKNQLSKLSMILIGFIGGVAFLISCDSDSTNDVAAADVPAIDDQMYCSSIAFIADQTSTTDTLFCMKQSTKVQQRYKSLAGIYAEDWIMINMSALGSTGQYLFYK